MKKRKVILSTCMSVVVASMLIGQVIPVVALENERTEAEELFIEEAEEAEELFSEEAEEAEDNFVRESDDSEALERGSVAINASTFPDANFRNYVKYYYDLNKDGYLSDSETNAVSDIDVVSYGISSLKGIEYFPGIQTLDCAINSINELDVSKNVYLTSLDCSYNNIKALDVSKNLYLEELYCSDNEIGNLDISKNIYLRILKCDGNNISSLDVSKNPELSTLFCYSTNISSLDVSKNPELSTLYCFSTNISSLDVSKNPELSTLSCFSTNISSLDVSKNPKLDYLICSYNYMHTLSLPSQKLCYLDISENLFTQQQVNAFADKADYFYGTPQVDKSAGAWAYVSRLYSTCLGRSASDNEIIYWDKYLRRTDIQGFSLRTGVQVAANFVFSPECSKKCVSDSQYITMLYQSLMGRTPATSEVNYWEGTLSSGLSRQYVFKFFAESSEFTKICQSYKVTRGSYALTQARDKNPNLTKYVNRIYANALGRNGDENGLNYWCNAIMTKKSTPVAAAEYFILSQEFTNKNLNNTEYVKVLYRTFMGREADQGGLSYWVSKLDNSESRKSVLRSFAGCPEFKKIIASFGL